MSSSDHGKIYILEFDFFTVFYNSDNGKIINVPREYIDQYLDQYFKINDFYGKPKINSV